MPSCGTPGTLRADSAYEVLAGLLDRRQEHVQRLNDCVAPLERAAMDTPQMLLELLERRNLIGKD